MERVRESFDKILMGICIFLFIFMTATGVYQITSRYLFKSPSTISEELISYSFAWMSMLAATYMFGKRDHMKMVFFVERFSKKYQNLVAICGEIIIFLFSAGVLIRGGCGITLLTMNQATAALKISMGYIYIIIPICGFIICGYSLLNIYDILKNIKGER